MSQVAAVTARRLELPGVVVEQVPTRYYPAHTVASHLFGYVGEVTDIQLQGAAGSRRGGVGYTAADGQARAVAPDQISLDHMARRRLA